jgi:branched-chain amino acid aminotransferase
MSEKIYLNGSIVDRSEAKVSVFDHGVLYGDGVFEGIRIYEGCIFRLDEHLDRLYSCARYIKLDIGMTKAEMAEATVETVRANDLKDGYIRLVVTRGEGTLGLDPDKCPNPNVFIIAAKIQLYPEKYYTEGLSIVTVPTRRNNAEIINPRVKSLNYLNNILGKIEAKLAGCEEALMLDHRGYVCECTGDNIFIIKDGVLTTPPTYLGALKGITRDAIIELAEADGITVKEEPFTRFEVIDADEVFLTGTAAEVVPVIQLDGRYIGDKTVGPITKKMIAKFHEIVVKDGRHCF